MAKMVDWLPTQILISPKKIPKNKTKCWNMYKNVCLKWRITLKVYCFHLLSYPNLPLSILWKWTTVLPGTIMWDREVEKAPSFHQKLWQYCDRRSQMHESRKWPMITSELFQAFQVYIQNYMYWSLFQG
jgi:hypothetical protein